MLQSIQLTNFLSYGKDAEPIGLGPLNVLIGPNGSGKSNLIEALEVLKAVPSDLRQPIRDGGGVRDWLWKGASGIPTATIDAVLHNDMPKAKMPLRYVLSFTGDKQDLFRIADERMENEKPNKAEMKDPFFYYRYQGGSPVLRVREPEGQQAGAPALRRLEPEEIDHGASILSQRKDPDQYPQLAYVSDRFSKIRIYREWAFGRYTVARTPQKADLPNDRLTADASNLGLVLNRLRQEPVAKKRLLGCVKTLYDGIEGVDVKIEGGTVQVFFEEGLHTIPGTRLSDGTLRYLCLLTVLCHPDPGPLICIEEPELGLHPDALSELATLLVEASERTQVIVTTHSEMLLDAFTDRPEAVVVVERDKKAGSRLTRLDAQKTKARLKGDGYGLGRLWMNGDLGGTRW